MFFKNVISLVMCGLLFCLVLVMCDKEAPIENAKDEESIQCEKDGVITILMTENITDTTAYGNSLGPKPPSDSFFISEIEHKMVIENAVQVSIPKMNNINYFFQGDFEGMEDEVIIWTDYIYASKSGRLYRELLADRLENNHGVAYLMRTDLDDTDLVRIYVFCLDTDNSNSGQGQLIISQDNRIDTVQVNAAHNTVCFPPILEAFEVEFEDRGFQRYLQFQCPDKESFITSNDGVIYFLTSGTSDKILRIGTSYSFAGIFVDDLTIKLNLYAFVPHFINRKE